MDVERWANVLEARVKNIKSEDMGDIAVKGTQIKLGDKLD